MMEIQNRMIKDIIQKLEEIFIEGLKNKGFQFETNDELKDFVKTRCFCEDRPHIKQRIYSVDGIPFLVHYYETVFEYKFNQENSTNRVIASYGRYEFV